MAICKKESEKEKLKIQKDCEEKKWYIRIYFYNKHIKFPLGELTIIIREIERIFTSFINPSAWKVLRYTQNKKKKKKEKARERSFFSRAHVTASSNEWRKISLRFYTFAYLPIFYNVGKVGGKTCRRHSQRLLLYRLNCLALEQKLKNWCEREITRKVEVTY